MTTTRPIPSPSPDGAPRLPGMSAAVMPQLTEHLGEATRFITEWMNEYGPSTPHPSQSVDPVAFKAAFDELTARLRANYPFFHPRYVGQMLKPPHPAAVVGYLTTMLINPNNHDLDAGAATTRMEMEAVDAIAAMFGCTARRTASEDPSAARPGASGRDEQEGTARRTASEDPSAARPGASGRDEQEGCGHEQRPCHLGHLTTSGTVANLEALFVARETHPRKSIAHSADAHYTHGRMSHLLNVPSVSIPTDDRGRMDLDALEWILKGGGIGTVVVTAGTTGLGAVDPIDKVIPLCRTYGVRVHVDAAYGGFFRLLADDDSLLAPEVAAAFRAIDQADSVVIDPHKHGLQPYGCGAVIFKDPDVANFYDHTSPYTYFTTGDDIHMGEISLECSRSGAAAAALWMTLQLLPLTREGMGEVIAPGRRAALKWAGKLRESELFELYQEPDLDIVSYFPRGDSLTDIDRRSGAILTAGMNAPRDESLFVATYQVNADDMAARGHVIDERDADSSKKGEPLVGARILRSVTMKPETEPAVDDIHAAVEKLARAAATAERDAPLPGEEVAEPGI